MQTALVSGPRDLSQTLAQAARWAGTALVSRFVNLRKSEAAREQADLLTDGPRAGKAEALAQPEHNLKALSAKPLSQKGIPYLNVCRRSTPGSAISHEG